MTQYILNKYPCAIAIIYMEPGEKPWAIPTELELMYIHLESGHISVCGIWDFDTRW